MQSSIFIYVTLSLPQTLLILTSIMLTATVLRSVVVFSPVALLWAVSSGCEEVQSRSLGGQGRQSDIQC